MWSTLKKYNVHGKEIGDVEIDDAFANAEANGQMIKDYIVALRQMQDNGLPIQKDALKSTIPPKNLTRKKGVDVPVKEGFPAPQYKGGGRVFGPKPKFDQHVRINKKERQAAIRFLIGEKIRDNQLRIIDHTTMKDPKTKAIAHFLKACEIKGRVLFLGEGHYAEIEAGENKQVISVRCDKHDNFIKSMRNIPKTDFSLAKNISGYDVIIAHEHCCD